MSHLKPTRPLEEDGVDVLEWIGFNTHAATELSVRYASRPTPHQNPDGLLDYVYSYIRGNDVNENKPPFAAMSSMGLKQSFQDALTDPQFEKIRGTQTLHFWIKDTLRINYHTVTMLQERFKEAADIIKAGNEKGEEPQAASIFQPSAASSSQTPPAITATLNVVAESLSVIEQHNLPAAHVSVEAAGPILQDHIVLYKAKAACDVQDLIDDDGQFNINSLDTNPGGDFNHASLVWYWTPEPSCAEEYRQWVQRRCPFSETWVIRIQIPTAAMLALKREDLWFGPDWKEYLWQCRNRKDPSPKFDKFWKYSDLMVGHICGQTEAVVHRIKKQNVQTAITSDFVLTLEDGRKAIQWVFMQHDSFLQILELARGKIHIEITQALARQPPGLQTQSP